MTQAHEAADAIRRMAKFYQNMQFAADTLERIGSLEQATQEAKAATLDAQTERDKALSELTEAKEATTAARA